MGLRLRLQPVRQTRARPEPTGWLLDEDVFSQSTLWDDDTNPGLEPLSVFEGDQAKGTWKLRLSHSAMEALDVTIDRFEIRLHTTPSMPCV